MSPMLLCCNSTGHFTAAQSHHKSVPLPPLAMYAGFDSAKGPPAACACLACYVIVCQANLLQAQLFES